MRDLIKNICINAAISRRSIRSFEEGQACLDDKSDIVEVLKFDSLDLMEVFFEIEEEFDVTINDRDISYLRTVDSIVEYLRRPK